MAKDVREFWQRVHHGIELAVAGSQGVELLGVRDGFLRFFHDRLNLRMPIILVPQEGVEEAKSGLALSAAVTATQVEDQAAQLQDAVGEVYDFCVATAGGLHAVEVAGQHRYFVHSWAAVHSSLGKALGASGSVQLPDRLVTGLDNEQIPFAVPGTRRRGGMLHSLTGGLETRRSAVATATSNALCSLFYGVLESRKGP